VRVIADDARSSDRVYLELPVILTGTDASGRKFVEETRTLVVNRRGAKIVSRHSLAPQQKLQIRCVRSGQDSDLRVVGPIGGDEEGFYYGIELLNAGAKFWGINFPPLTGAGKGASSVLLECTRCNAQEVAHLGVFELEVLLANECLMRPCSQCLDATLWMPPAPRAETSSRAIPSVPHPPLYDRKNPRIHLKVDVCIRHAVCGDETVATDNVSRGGFRFRSKKGYAVATLLEVALPYIPGAANIFAPARIVYKEEPSADGRAAYGVAFVPCQFAPSLTGMRIASPD
jgi:hypothetical protein